MTKERGQNLEIFPSPCELSSQEYLSENQPMWSNIPVGRVLGILRKRYRMPLYTSIRCVFRTGSGRPLLEGLSFIFLENKDVAWLERELTVDEAVDTIIQLNGDYALGPGGVVIAFFQNCWEVVREYAQGSFMNRGCLREV